MSTPKTAHNIHRPAMPAAVASSKAVVMLMLPRTRGRSAVRWIQRIGVQLPHLVEGVAGAGDQGAGEQQHQQAAQIERTGRAAHPIAEAGGEDHQAGQAQLEEGGRIAQQTRGGGDGGGGGALHGEVGMFRSGAKGSPSQGSPVQGRPVRSCWSV